MMQLANYFSEIFKLIVFVSQQIDQWFDRINLLKDDSGSTFTAMLYGSIGGGKAYLKLEGAQNTGFMVIQGAGWIEQENLAFGLPLLGPKARTEFLELTDHSQEVGFPGGSGVKKIHLQYGRLGFDPWVGKMPWRRVWQPTPVFLPGESPWTEESGRLSRGCKELEKTEGLSTAQPRGGLDSC